MISIKRTTWYFGSFILGGVIGSALALLYAPESGRHLRRDIKRKTNDLIEDGKKKAQDTWNDARETAESALESANEFINSGMDKIMRNTEKAKDALKSGYAAYYDEKKTGDNQSKREMEEIEKFHSKRM
jgi:gas vesicle protein